MNANAKSDTHTATVATLQSVESRAWKAETALQAAGTYLREVRGTLQAVESRAWAAETALQAAQTRLATTEELLHTAESRGARDVTVLGECRAVLSRAESRAWKAETEPGNLRATLVKTETTLRQAQERLEWLEGVIIPEKDALLVAYAAANARVEALPPARMVRRLQRWSKQTGETLLKVSRRG